MSIVSVEVDSVHGSADGQRMIFYRCLDGQGIRVNYGPIITTDPAFDPQAYCQVLLDKLNQEPSE